MKALQPSAFITILGLSLSLIFSVPGFAASGHSPNTNNSLAKAAGQDDRKSGIHDGNKILTIIYNYGGIGDWTISSNRLESGIYPRGSGYSYFAEFSPVIGAEATNNDGETIHIFSDGMVSGTMMDQAPEGYQYGFEPLPGYANPLQNTIAMSDQPETWPATWPNRPQDWDGFWNGQYGKYSRADQESYFVMNDYFNDEFSWYPKIKQDWQEQSGSVLLSVRDTSDAASAPKDTSLILVYTNGGFEGQPRIRTGLDDGDRVILHDDEDRFYQISSIIGDDSLRLRKVPGSVVSRYFGFSESTSEVLNFTIVDGRTRGLGFEVEARGYQWSNVAAEDILIFTYWITNKSTHEYDRVIFGMYGDADVGDDGDQHDDDAWFDTKADIVYQYDHDFWSTAKGGFRPVYFGYRFLESPGDPTDGEDNDEDGMVDESQQDGIDNDGDWKAYEDINGNGQWDTSEPINDDVGTDGLGPDDNGYPGPDVDDTQGNGLPDPGEPNFEFTDNDESDQIGLTSFNAGPWPGLEIQDDEVTWNRMRPGNFENIQQTLDLTFLYGSGYFSLAPEQSRKFSIAMVFGEDEDDIFRNADIIQRIYDADYAFAKPPIKPTVTAVPGDKKVTLYWDNRAEKSNDHIYGKDFEGYRIYRSTDPNFQDNWEITDAYGNRTFYKPIAQFDLENGLKGPHPLDYNGVKFDMGDDTGLQYKYVDENVNNGQTYYYAVTSYDKGYAEDFYERGIVSVDSLPPIPPSESSKTIKSDVIGEIERLDVNTIAVTPNAPAAGYQPPARSNFDSTEVYGTGDIDIEFIDPMKVKPANTYEIQFTDTKTDGIDNDGDFIPFSDDNGNGVWDTDEPLNDDIGTDLLAPGDSAYVGPDADGSQGNGQPDPGEPKLDHRDYDELRARTLSYSVYNTTNPGNTYPIIENSQYLDGENFNPFEEGMQITVNNDTVVPDVANSGFVAGDCNWNVTAKLYSNSQNPGIPYPMDYHVRLYDQAAGKDFFGNDISYQIWEEFSGDSVITANIDGILVLTLLPHESKQFQPSWQISPESKFGKVQDIFVDAKNRIWVGTAQNGLGMYSNGNWSYFTPEERGLFFPAQNIRQIIQTINGNLLFATSTGVIMLSEDGDDMQIGSFSPDGLNSSNVTALALDNMNRLWIGTDNGVKGFTQDVYRESFLGKRQIRLTPVNEDSLPLPSPQVTTLYQDDADNLWVGTNMGYTRANFSSDEIDSVYVDETRFNVFYKHDGTLFAGTNKGIFRYQNGTFVADSLAGINIRDFITYNDTLYVASNNALYAYKTDASTITKYTKNSGDLTDNLTTSLAVSEPNHLWIGNNVGIDRNENGTWASFNPEPGDEYIFRVKKNFTSKDSLVFTTQGAEVNVDSAKQSLDDIAVVPNPYVVTAKWEPQHFYTSGRGERKIDFINLPPKCTIRIFTLRGFLVEKIEHNTTIKNGAESWDLTSKDGLDVAYGVYIYHVDAEGIGEHIGKFALIK